MNEINQNEITEFEKRKLALEELREENRAKEVERAHELALAQAKAASIEPHVKAKSQASLALLSALAAVAGGMASLGAAYVAGVFNVEQHEVLTQGESNLERLKFANSLISDALSEGFDKRRAQRRYG